jgi:predicted ester cyclase
MGDGPSSVESTTESTRTFIADYIQRVWIDRDLSALRSMLTPDEDVQREATMHLRQLWDAFDELTIRVHQVLADGELAAVHSTVSGVHTGSFAGIPPTGHRVSYDTFRIFQVRSGRIVASWAMQDRLGLLRQIGVVGDLPGVNWAGNIS